MEPVEAPEEVHEVEASVPQMTLMMRKTQMGGTLLVQQEAGAVVLEDVLVVPCQRMSRIPDHREALLAADMEEVYLEPLEEELEVLLEQVEAAVEPVDAEELALGLAQASV